MYHSMRHIMAAAMALTRTPNMASYIAEIWERP